MRVTFASHAKFILVLLPLVVLVLFYSRASALELLNRKVSLGNTTISTTTTYDFSFDVVSSSLIGSIVFEYCSNSPLDNVVCVAPSGFDTSNATISAQSGETGFAVHANTNTNTMVLSRVPSVTTPGAVQYVFDSVVNPDAMGSYYTRIHTYATTDGSGASTDRGGFAYTINEELNVAAYVPPILRFCVASSIPGPDCSSATGSNVALGILSETTTSTGTTQMMAATNGVGGYNISIIGTTMTSGNNIIEPLIAKSPSTPGIQQFGLNLRSNTNPTVGRNVSGAGAGSVSSGYADVNQFKYASGDVVASSSISTEFNNYTSSYIVNISEDQPPGVYATTITYIAFASF